MGGFTGVLEGLRLAEQKRQTDVQAQVSRENTQAQSQLQMERIKQEQDRLKEGKRQYDLQHALAIQTAELMKRAKALEFMQAEAALSPSAAREMSEAEEVPKLESQIKQIEAQAREQGGQQRLTQAAGDEFDRSLTEYREGMETARDKARNISNERIAGIRASQGIQLDYDPGVYIDQIASSNISRNQLLKQLPKNDALQIMNAATNSGLGIPDDDQVKLVGDFKGVVDAIRIMDEFLDANPKTKGFVGATASGIAQSVNKDITTLEGQMQGRATPIARVIARERGVISNKDVERVVKGYQPTRFNDFKNNKKMRNDFIKDVAEVVLAKTKNLSKAQQSHILDGLGLTPYLKELITSQSQGQGSRIKILSVE